MHISPELRDTLLVAVGAAFFALWGVIYLFGARRMRDAWLASNGGHGFIARMNRFFLTSPGYVLSFRIVGAISLIVSLLLLALLIAHGIGQGLGR